jgi:hypothetical protein
MALDRTESHHAPACPAKRTPQQDAGLPIAMDQPPVCTGRAWPDFPFTQEKGKHNPSLALVSNRSNELAGGPENAAHAGIAAARPEPDDVTALDEDHSSRRERRTGASSR